MGRWDYFLSYAGKDLDLAGDLQHALEKIGCKVWFDRNEIREEGRFFHSPICEGLIEADHLCVLSTRNTSLAEWVNREIQQFVSIRAADKTQPKIPATMFFLYDEGADATQRPLENSADFFIKFYGSDIQKEVLYLSHSDPVAIAKEVARLATPRSGPLQRVFELFRRRTRIHRSHDPRSRPKNLQEYWDQENVILRWTAVDVAKVLITFDNLTAPYHSWTNRYRNQIDAQIQHVLEMAVTGKRVLRIANRAPQSVIARITGAPAALQSISIQGSPVGLLISLGMEMNILDEVQNAFYSVRGARQKDANRDYLDLTLVLASGYIIDRWVRMQPPIEEVVDAIVNEEHLSDL